MMVVWVIIYLLGAVVAYISAKHAIIACGGRRTWSDVILGFLVSTISWLGAVAILITALITNEWLNKKDPPKWL